MNTSAVIRPWLASAATALHENEVHVYRADLDRPDRLLPHLARSLSPDELQRADAFVFPPDRERFIVARGVLRGLLAGYLDCEPAALSLHDGPYGKPELPTSSGQPPLQFNYSRSQHCALYAVTRAGRIGVDLEALRSVPEAEEIARQCFSAREQATLGAVPTEQRNTAFLRAWTRKEAYAKAVGLGLARRLEGIEVTLAINEPPALRAIDGDPVEAARWSLQEPPPTPGYVAALAVETQGHSLRCWSPCHGSVFERGQRS